MYGFNSNNKDMFSAASDLQDWIDNIWNTEYTKEHSPCISPFLHGSEVPNVLVSICSFAASIEIDTVVIWCSESNEEEPTFDNLLKLFRKECGKWALFAEEPKCNL